MVQLPDGGKCFVDGAAAICGLDTGRVEHSNQVTANAELCFLFIEPAQ